MGVGGWLPCLPVHRRIGGLEKFLLFMIEKPDVHRRIGGLEMHTVFRAVSRIVHRRIGGLEMRPPHFPKYR